MSGPIPFPSANHLPIVGQPFTIKSWLACVNVVCNCEAKEPVLIVGFNMPAFCPACRRGFAIGVIQFNGQTGQNHVGIGVIMAPQEKQPS